MSFAYEIRRQAEAAPRAALPAITAALWRAFGDGRITEAEAEVLSELIEARRNTAQPRERLANSQETHIPHSDEAAKNAAGSPRRAVGSRPRTELPRWSAVAAGPPWAGSHLG